MIVFRRRLMFWLVKEYVRRWRKTIILFFILGILAFFGLQFLVAYFIPKIPIGLKETIGIVGAYSADSIPSFVLADASIGLTKVSAQGNIESGLANSWGIEQNGKKYIFHLKKDITFNDGAPLTSDLVSYNFSDVTITRPNTYDVIFTLKDSYAPFLVTVSKPLFKKNFIGTGDYNVRNIETNGNFIKSIALVAKKNKYQVKTYLFYPTQEALKLAFVLGEITEAFDLTDLTFKNTKFSKFPNARSTKRTDYGHLVTIFYNTDDKVLSDKRLRQSLTYLLPDTFEMGERSFIPYSQNSWAYQKSINEPSFDLEHARVLSEGSIATDSASFVLNIKTLPRFKTTADVVSNAWKKANIQSKIEIVDTVPIDFQVFIGDFNVPKDPDQYTLWHSNQDNNITKLKSLRIDKLLEDGRKTVGVLQRKKIYADFLKYLLDESPASFLYFPYEYDLARK